MPSRTPDIARGGAADPAAPTGTEDAAGTGALNIVWADRFVAALAEAGVRDAVLAPGSRSAPLALALHRSSIRTHIALDERAGAFFALGLARGARRPAAILTTSGTAAANLLPAIVEAHHGRVPLLALTADRPPELRDTGAPQTMDQLKLFGGFVRWFCEVGAPAPGDALLEYVGSLGARAVAEAWRPPAAPVHLNFSFREPLLPGPDAVPAAPRAASGLEVAGPPEPSPPPARTIARIAKLLRARRRGLIVCGPDDAGDDFPAAVASLAAVTGYPVLADPASQVRYGPHDRGRVLGAYDAFLRMARHPGDGDPEAILQFGAPLTSRAYHRFADLHPASLRVVVDPAGVPRDPSRRAREVIAADPALTAGALGGALGSGADPLPAWLERWRAADRAAREAVEAAIRAGHAPFDGHLFAELLPALPDGATLYVGNSMAIRDLDAFAPGAPCRVRVLANRGANGIDGIVSSALGAAAASEGPLVVVTGDLSFHHDLNALHLARDGRARATIVLLHNDGGGIFSFLPIARHGDAFERCFGTPHGLDFEPVAALYGVPFRRASDAPDAVRETLASLHARDTRIVELRSDRAENRAAHQAVWDAAVRAMEALA